MKFGFKNCLLSARYSREEKGILWHGAEAQVLQSLEGTEVFRSKAPPSCEEPDSNIKTFVAYDIS